MMESILSIWLRKIETVTEDEIFPDNGLVSCAINERSVDLP